MCGGAGGVFLGDDGNDHEPAGCTLNMTIDQRAAGRLKPGRPKSGYDGGTSPANDLVLVLVGGIRRELAGTESRRPSWFGS